MILYLCCRPHLEQSFMMTRLCFVMRLLCLMRAIQNVIAAVGDNCYFLQVITGCFGYELVVAKPQWGEVAKGFIPKPSIITNRDTLYAAIGILGATVMPHNLFLHSSVVQTRAYPRTASGTSSADLGRLAIIWWPISRHHASISGLFCMLTIFGRH